MIDNIAKIPLSEVPFKEIDEEISYEFKVEIYDGIN